MKLNKKEKKTSIIVMYVFVSVSAMKVIPQQHKGKVRTTQGIQKLTT